MIKTIAKVVFVIGLVWSLTFIFKLGNSFALSPEYKKEIFNGCYIDAKSTLGNKRAKQYCTCTTEMLHRKFSDEDILELAIEAGAQDCKSNNDIHEIISKKEDFYKVKSIIEKKINEFNYSGIEWRPHNEMQITKEQSKKILQLLETLDDDDDVQNTFINCNIELN